MTAGFQISRKMVAQKIATQVQIVAIRLGFSD